MVSILNGIYFNKRQIFVIFSIFLIVIMAISFTNVVSAADITVTPNSPGGLKDAIATAEKGDTISLQNGVYTGVNNTNITINKNINIRGLGSNVVIEDKNSNRIFILQKAKVSINNIKFIGSTTNKDVSIGGLISLNKSSLTLSSCTFSNVLALNDRAIFSQSSYLTVNSCSFRNNNYAIELLDSKCSAANSAFINSRAYGIYTIGSNMTISASTFTNNTVYGAIGFIQGRLKVTSSTFKNNQARYGAGVGVRNGVATISNCTFINNNASLYGGAVDSESSIMNVSKCIFKNNHASIAGGAIYSIEGSLNVKKSTFSKNQAKNDGGAIKTVSSGLYPQFNSKITVSGSTFTNNKANYDAGAISNSKLPLKITDSTFKKNIAGKVYKAIYTVKGKLTKKNVKISPKDNTKVKK